MKRLLAALIVLILMPSLARALPPCPDDPGERHHNCYGTHTWSDGRKYVGEWKDDLFHGQGIQHRADGTVEKEGIWENDEFKYSRNIASQEVRADFQRGKDAYLRGDWATARREFEPLAQQGNAFAQYSLGMLYAGGKGVLQDWEEAVKWLQLAAEQGHPTAQYNLGVMVNKGLGVPQSFRTAAKWFRLSAEQGFAPAQSNLGAIYGNGRGVQRDSLVAYMWYSIAASSGLKQALKNRDLIAKYMTSSQVGTAQRLARECVRKNYKGC